MTGIRSALRVLMAVAGVAASAAALFAYRLGLDSNPDWGPSRRLLLGAGLLLLVLAGLPAAARGTRHALANVPLFGRLHWALRKGFSAATDHRLARWLRRMWASTSSRASGAIDRSFVLRSLLGTRLKKAAVVGLALWGLAVVSYVWIGSVGTWVDWPPTTADFDLLAEGFEDGRLSLPVDAPPELLAMPDPYIMESRQYLPDLWDVSFFDGKFYLYWGPVPAALLVPWKAVADLRVDDGILTGVFAAGVSLAAMLGLLYLWRRWPMGLPWWMMAPPTAALVWAAPIVWLPTRGAVYEVAISSGQAFLLLGLLAALPAWWGDELSPWRLAAASASLTMAAGSRISLGPACAVIMVLALLPFVRAARRRRLNWATMLAAGVLPALAGAIALGAYNKGRFGDLLEFGHRFQLGRADLFHNYATVFKLGNIVPNLYNYLLNGVHTLSVFPYIKPDWGQYYIWVTHTYAPEAYHTEKITGILIGIPFLWLTGVLLWRWGRKLLISRQDRGELATKMSAVDGVELRLAGVALALVVPLSTFLAVSMRHEVDFVPVLGILAAAEFWQGYTRLRSSTLARRVWVALGFTLALASVVIGLLLAMTGFQGNFEVYNPELFHKLTSLFTF